MADASTAWVSLILAALVVLEEWAGWSVGFITKEWIVTLLAVLTPLFTFIRSFIT